MPNLMPTDIQESVLQVLKDANQGKSERPKNRKLSPSFPTTLPSVNYSTPSTTITLRHRSRGSGGRSHPVVVVDLDRSIRFRTILPLRGRRPPGAAPRGGPRRAGVAFGPHVLLLLLFRFLATSVR